MTKSRIEWTELTWNPLRGCSRVSDGCRNCYAERMANRFASGKPYRAGPFCAVSLAGSWTGSVELIESKLNEPLCKRKPSVIFVASMSDTFHERVPDEWIDRIFAVMALCPQHKFLMLTKRARRMREWHGGGQRHTPVIDQMRRIGADVAAIRWPLPNVALGVSCEDRAHFERIDELRQTPAAMRFVSFEPLLGDPGAVNLSGISWVICGGESGPGARPCHPGWVRSLRDQCVSAGVPFFFKQWGEWLPYDQFGADGDKPSPATTGFAKQREVWSTATSDGSRDVICYRVGKRNASRLLDGRAWDHRPEEFIGR